MITSTNSADSEKQGPLADDSGPGGTHYQMVVGATLKAGYPQSDMREVVPLRCWRGPESKYKHLLEDTDIKRWYNNVSRGSKITADVYLRRLGSLCNTRGLKNPKGLLFHAEQEGGKRWLYNLVIGMN